MLGLRTVAVLVLALGALGFSPVASAQDTGVSGELVRSASASPEEKLAYALAANEEMRNASKSVSRLVEQARRDSNTNRLQCLTNRLTAIRSLLQVSESAEVAMKEALSNTADPRASERADHEFRKIAVARQKTSQLYAEAEQCMDDSGLQPGETVVTVNGGVDSEGDDTEGVTTDVFDLGFDPPEASPFQ